MENSTIEKVSENQLKEIVTKTEEKIYSVEEIDAQLQQIDNSISHLTDVLRPYWQNLKDKATLLNLKTKDEIVEATSEETQPN